MSQLGIPNVYLGGDEALKGSEKMRYYRTRWVGVNIGPIATGRTEHIGVDDAVKRYEIITQMCGAVEKEGLDKGTRTVLGAGLDVMGALV